jgi:hypothetical protein
MRYNNRTQILNIGIKITNVHSKIIVQTIDNKKIIECMYVCTNVCTNKKIKKTHNLNKLMQDNKSEAY